MEDDLIGPDLCFRLTVESLCVRRLNIDGHKTNRCDFSSLVFSRAVKYVAQIGVIFRDRGQGNARHAGGSDCDNDYERLCISVHRHPMDASLPTSGSVCKWGPIRRAKRRKMVDG